MTNRVSETGNGQNITSSTLIATGVTDLLGIWVSSASSTPTIKVWDNTAAFGAIIANTFTPSASTFYPLPFRCGAGVYVTISGTVDCTVCTKPRIE